MKYLTAENLTVSTYQRLIDECAEKPENQNGEPPIFEEIENRVIAFVSAYLSGRYDTAKIFNETNPVINELLVDIMTRIFIYRLIKRNAARKVPTDAKEDYDAAIKQLEAINAGKIKLDDLPKPTDGSGNPTSKPIYGNNSNRDYYI